MAANGYLQLRDVAREFTTPRGRFVAIKQFTLDIARGEFVVLIGHSGCGKSTVLNMIAGLLPPTQGTIWLAGQRIERPGPDRGMVFQNYSLLPWLSVRDNVYEAVDAALRDRSRAEKLAIVEQALRTVGLDAHRDKHPHQLSGGMKQRVAVARAFAIHPQVLLLDEPFGALDALTRAELQEELLRLWQHDSRTETVVMVTHDIDEAIYLADRTVVMTNGPAATIAEVLAVDLPRPRDKRAIVHDPRYADLKDRLLYLLTIAFAQHAA